MIIFFVQHICYSLCGGGGRGSGGAGRGVAQRSGSGGSQSQQQQRGTETPSPQQLREWYAGRQRGGGAGPCTYVLRTGDRTGEQCGGPHSTQRCFGRLMDAWRHQFPDATEIPRWGDLSRAGVAVFDFDYDAILAAMYALSTSDEGDCYLCVPPDPGIAAAALGAGETAALGASASAAPGAGELHHSYAAQSAGCSLPGSSRRSGSGGGQRQQQQRGQETLSSQQLREWYAARQRGGGPGPCTYVLRTGDRAGEPCGGPHSSQRCFGRLTDAWRRQFPDASEIPRWDQLSRAGVAIFDLDFDAILRAMYAVTISEEDDCYRCFPPDPGIGTAAPGTAETAALGAGEAAALGASESVSPGAGESALSGTASTPPSLTFTLDSGASRSFFRDRTTLTPLSRPMAVSLADPSGGPVLACYSTVLPCPALPSGSLSGLYLPSFSTNLVAGADLQDAGVDQFTPARRRDTHCTDEDTGQLLATFTRGPGSSLYTLTVPSPPPASGQVAASGQVFAAASRSGPESAPCSCRLLSHETLLWHHRMGHPSLPRLRGMASRLLVSGLPRSLPPLPPGPSPPCVPCVEGRLRATPHSSPFPPTEAPMQTLHMDVLTSAFCPFRLGFEADSTSARRD
ncbi:unnamed protein product [Closterium sp. NIES-53]